jgi:hypothetical protein
MIGPPKGVALTHRGVAAEEAVAIEKRAAVKRQAARSL